MSHAEDKKDKKKEVRERNKRNWIIFKMVEEQLDKVDIGAPDTPLKTGKGPKKDEEIWSQKLVSIRNRLDNSKRKADERWNRFAATGDSGGRGR
jgi:hypothetical protein